MFAYAVALVLDTDMAAGPTRDSLDTRGNGDGGFEMRTVLLRPATDTCVHFSMIPFDASLTSLIGAPGLLLGCHPEEIPSD